MPSRAEHATDSDTRKILPNVQLRREFRSFTYDQLITYAQTTDTAEAVTWSLKKEQEKLKIRGDSVLSADTIRAVMTHLDKTSREDNSVGSHFLRNERLLVELFFDTILESSNPVRRAFEGLHRCLEGSVHH